MKKYIGGLLIVCIALHCYVRSSLQAQRNAQKVKLLAMRLKNKRARAY